MKNFNTLLTLSELKEHYGNPPVGICPLYYGKLDKTIVESKTGNLIVLPPYKAITSLNISFSPKQAGSGDPSPENVRAISGWDSLSVTRCGKNLFDDTKAIYNPVFWSYDSASNEWRTEESQATSFYVELPLGRGSYVLRTQVTALVGDQAKLSIRTTENVTVAQNFFNDVGLVSLQWTCENEGTYRIMLGGTSTGKVYMKNVMFELGSTPAAYEPYQGDTYDIALPETVYGGMVDAVTGVGSKSWGYIASYNGESLPGEWISDRDVYASGTTPTTGAQVAYQLATPEPFKVNPISMPSLGGINTIYSDADNLSCDFKISSFWGDAD